MAQYTCTVSREIASKISNLRGAPLEFNGEPCLYHLTVPDDADADCKLVLMPLGCGDMQADADARANHSVADAS